MVARHTQSIFPVRIKKEEILKKKKTHNTFIANEKAFPRGKYCPRRCFCFFKNSLCWHESNNRRSKSEGKRAIGMKQ